VHVSRIGLTPLKGTRHADRPSVELQDGGPVGDRVFCLVDRARRRVVRTVENPALIATRARWEAGLLTTVLPAGTVEDVPAPSGEVLDVDYWGRTVPLQVLTGPWASAYSEFLGYRVVLARAPRPGDVVYGNPVSLVTTSSLERLSSEVGGPVDEAQLRTTFTVDSGDGPADVEDGWIGRRLRIGAAEVEVRAAIPRCAVVDLDPVTGGRRARVLRTMASYRRVHGEILFGVDATVTRPGRVTLGDPVERG
jgi:uncharacterized protein YcbX